MYTPGNSHRAFVEHVKFPKVSQVSPKIQPLFALLTNYSCVCIKGSFVSIVVRRYNIIINRPNETPWNYSHNTPRTNVRKLV